jgi:trimeric autotransporter adhesin
MSNYINTTGTFNTTGEANTANGVAALIANTTGFSNTAFGHAAGALSTTGSYNVFLGSNVWGTNADTNTIRIGSTINVLVSSTPRS